MFGELSRKAPDCSPEHLSNEILAIAMRIQADLAKADEIRCSARGLFGKQHGVIRFCLTVWTSEVSSDYPNHRIASHSIRWQLPLRIAGTPRCVIPMYEKSAPED
jgi:hypothetical protein